MHMDSIDRYVEDVIGVLKSLPTDDVRGVLQAVRAVREHGRRIFVLGNGGSAATASHMACDLAKMTIAAGENRIKIVSLTDNTPLMTAWANDVAYEDVFAEQLWNLAGPGDLVICISGSGKSPNVLKAARAAKEIGARTVAFTGCPGSPLERLADISVAVSAPRIELAEDIHLILEHMIAVALREEVRMIGDDSQRVVILSEMSR